MSRDGLTVELEKYGEQVTVVKDGKNAMTEEFDKNLDRYVYIIPED